MKNDPAPRLEGQSYIELTGPAEYEEKIQRSVFIGRTEPCHSEAEARELLNCVRAAHRDATHNCWAYRLGPEPTIEYSSDDGEPSGTAGRPILGAIQRVGCRGSSPTDLQSRGLFNVIVIVTRYFGGVKLGVRGLIEAYGGAAARTLDAAEMVERVPVRLLAVRLPWASVGTVTRLLEGHGGTDLTWDYSSTEQVSCRGNRTDTIPVISVTARVPCASIEALSQTLASLKAQEIIAGWESDVDI
ncbi:MAG: YigZ family protein [Fretibacterium sp.]|nr:YigZ family protein [Fretibacterium sp.]